mmetsp:Transcript_16694/g.45206  ORF Transcript_16694/g.45206 Transcript_16694/m.45206 type:complete len:406 (+) Transcript_16694:259-1476(+)
MQELVAEHRFPNASCWLKSMLHLRVHHLEDDGNNEHQNHTHEGENITTPLADGEQVRQIQAQSKLVFQQQFQEEQEDGIRGDRCEHDMCVHQSDDVHVHLKEESPEIFQIPLLRSVPSEVLGNEWQHHKNVRHIREPQGMSLRLLPPCADGSEPGVVLGRVVDGGRHDRPHLRSSKGEQVTLDAHVPILSNPLGIPPSDCNRQRHGQRVRGVRESYRVRVRKCRALEHASEETADKNRRRLSVVVLEVQNWRLPEGQVLHVAADDEITRYFLKVCLVELRVGVSHTQDNLCNVCVPFLEARLELLEGPCCVARLPRWIVGKIRWVVGLHDVQENTCEALSQKLNFCFGSLLALFHREHHPNRLRNGTLRNRLYRIRKDINLFLVIRQDHPLLHIGSPFAVGVEFV